MGRRWPRWMTPKLMQLRDIMWEMNAVSSSTRTESHEVEVIITDEDGKETTRTETVTETILRLPSPTKPRRKWPEQYSFQRPAERIPRLNVGAGEPEPVGGAAGRL